MNRERRLIVRRGNDLGFDRALKVRDFLRSLVDQQDQNVDVRMVRRDRVGDLLENGRLA